MVAVHVFVLCKDGVKNDSFQSINNTYRKNVNKHWAPNLYSPTNFSEIFEWRTSTEGEPFLLF